MYMYVNYYLFFLISYTYDKMLYLSFDAAHVIVITLFRVKI